MIIDIAVCRIRCFMFLPSIWWSWVPFTDASKLSWANLTIYCLLGRSHQSQVVANSSYGAHPANNYCAAGKEAKATPELGQTANVQIVQSNFP